MEIYRNLGITDEKGLRSGTKMRAFRIEGAMIDEGAYNKKDALVLQIIESLGNTGCSYGLIGKVKDEFMSKIGIKNIEDFNGKYVIGFVHDNESVLQGLGILYNYGDK